MASRAQLLAGLRTGGPRTSSPSIESQSGAQLKASAAPFMPGQRDTSDATTSELESRFASLRMQQAIAASTDSHNLAAMYGATNGQPFASYDDEVSSQLHFDNLELLIQRKRAQAMQLQHAQQQQSHLDHLRMQAAVYQQHQQQQQQQLAAQQYLILAQLQADAMMQNAQQEQRQAARNGLQNTLRQRQAQQAYNQIFSQHSGPPAPQNEGELRQQQQALVQQLQYLRQHQHQANGTASPASDSATSWRSNSTSVLKGRTSGASEQATSWRSHSVSTTTAKEEPSSPPSIIVDDSASEPSECESTNSKHDVHETPETSAEDVSPSMRSFKKKKYVEQSALDLAATRPLALAAAPRSRVLSAEIKPMGSRQPRGPPTEFVSVNFATRLAAKTRREAMTKLCASPRAATFGAAVTVS